MQGSVNALKIRDLHCHSLASDGVLSPPELLLRAQKNGVEQLALTDHDTVAGVIELQTLQQVEGFASSVELVPGVEITAMIERQSVHIVGLWIDTSNAVLQQFLQGQALVRQQRGVSIAERLTRVGVLKSLEGALKIAGDAVLSRPHFARFLVEAGYCVKEQQAFKRWLGAGKVADVPCQWPALEQVVDVIHQAGGLTVLAHPNKYRLTRNKKNTLFTQFKAVGGDAIELISGVQQVNDTRDLMNMINKHGLACSTGSDFHTPEQTWCDLGTQQMLPEAAIPVWALRLCIWAD